MQFEILCVTMGQSDFSKIKDMNIHSNVVFANQGERTAYDEFHFENYTAKMISTNTRGVGINRNLALMYASADICLLADDDVVYYDNYKEAVLKEFETHPDADIFIFHFDTDSVRKQVKYKKTRKCSKFTRMPWAGFRIAFRLSSIKKANIWFTTLFGGGCIFPSGEDSMWLETARKAGLTFYVSQETIGKVSFDESTWFDGYNEKFYYGKGAYYKATHPKTLGIWMLYFAYRTRKFSALKYKERLKWMKLGSKNYKKLISYNELVS